MSSEIIQALEDASQEERRQILSAWLARVVAERDGKTLRGVIHYYIPKVKAPPDRGAYVYSSCPQGGLTYKHNFTRKIKNGKIIP